MKDLHINALLAVPALFFAASANATSLYVVKPEAKEGELSVQLTVRATGPSTSFQMPEWMPGYYVLEQYGKRVKDVAAVDAKGEALTVEKVDGHTWKVHSVKGGTIMFRYSTNCEFDEGVGHYSGAPTYVYVVGRKNEPCRLHLELQKGWNVAVGLTGKGAEYSAPNYDVLADNSVTFGAFREATYVAAGKPHTLALRGRGAKDVDLKKLAQECALISDIETDYFGGAPYDKYVWHFIVHRGQGPQYGIEHLTSTEISLSSKLDAGTAGLLCHEYFHLWNVKRIRSRALGPFDYTKLPRTGALWWLEGVTDYLSQSLIRRYGRTTDVEYFGDIAGDARNLRANPAHFTVSPYDSSSKVGDAAGGFGNSDGYGISYYECGFLVGLCLDIELLSRTDGKRSLDDVEMALWKMCRNDQPGFEEGEIRRQLIRFGGAAFGPLYDQWVLHAGELPLEAQLAKVGLKVSKGPDGRLSITAGDSVTEHQIRLRGRWLAKRR